jgi:hypothetical protein
MRKYFTLHFLTLFVFFAAVTLLKRYFEAYYLLFWIGGIVGTFMPDLDQLIYIYLLSPSDPISQEAQSEISKRHYIGTWSRLIAGRRERTKLIFHTVQFNALFLLLSIFVLTSSASIFGHGLVLGFALHLFIDQYIDFKELGNLGRWFHKLQISLDQERLKLYLITNFILLLIFGLYL